MEHTRTQHEHQGGRGANSAFQTRQPAVTHSFPNQPLRAENIAQIGPISARLDRLASLLYQSGLELLWPTRCVLCDVPGEPLCRDCIVHLPYIDTLLNCPLCGAPWGINQCSECNSYMLAQRNRSTFPLDGCASLFRADAIVKRLITSYKDSDERRLAILFATFMAHLINPAWHIQGICPIPTTKRAYKRRGFDHTKEVAHALSEQTELPLVLLLEAHRPKDQRGLGRTARINNMSHAFTLSTFGTNNLKWGLPERILLYDDVMTTGATLFSACDVLKEAGVKEVFALTLARV